MHCHALDMVTILSMCHALRFRAPLGEAKDTPYLAFSKSSIEGLGIEFLSQVSSQNRFYSGIHLIQKTEKLSFKHFLWRRSIVVITTAQLYSTKP